MTTKVSDPGLLFISSWSIYSDTVYRVEHNFSGIGKYLGFFDGNVLSSFSGPFDIDEDRATTDEETALACLRSSLNKIAFKLLTDFGFEKFSQNQFDALISLLTVDSRGSDFYDYFKNSELYKILKTDASDPVISDLIIKYKGNIDLKNSGAFYSFADRRLAEADLYTSGVYNNCTNLLFEQKIVDGVKVFYSASS